MVGVDVVVAGSGRRELTDHDEVESMALMSSYVLAGDERKRHGCEQSPFRRRIILQIDIARKLAGRECMTSIAMVSFLNVVGDIWNIYGLGSRSPEVLPEGVHGVSELTSGPAL